MIEQRGERQSELLDRQHGRTEVKSSPEMVAGKKEFVEPVVFTPVDVLEATTFFQGTDSGGTG